MREILAASPRSEQRTISTEAGGEITQGRRKPSPKPTAKDDNDRERWPMILPDHLRQGLDVVFCGTAAGDHSAARGHYYAGPGNKFWWTLQATGLTHALLTPDHDSHLIEHGIGFTDLVKHHSGNDNTLLREMYDVADFVRKIDEHAPRFIAFNGKKGAAVYLGLTRTSSVRLGLQDWLIGRAQVFVLPSTSGNASGYWDAKPWHDLADMIARQRNDLHP